MGEAVHRLLASEEQAILDLIGGARSTGRIASSRIAAATPRRCSSRWARGQRMGAQKNGRGRCGALLTST